MTGYYFSGAKTCGKCHYSCLKCDGTTEDDCISCDEDQNR